MIGRIIQRSPSARLTASRNHNGVWTSPLRSACALHTAESYTVAARLLLGGETGTLTRFGRRLTTLSERGHPCDRI